MKNILLTLLVAAALPLFVSAQAADDHTAQEEAAGRAIWVEMEAGTLTCDDLSDEDFAALGEYFMGLMLGASHEAMNLHMIQTMGEEGEEKMHVILGKRTSGCDPNAETAYGMMPMMMGMGGSFWGTGSMMDGGIWNNGSMMGSWGGQRGFYGNGMMNGTGGYRFATNPLSGILTLLFWGLAIIGTISAGKYVLNIASHPKKND